MLGRMGRGDTIRDSENGLRFQAHWTIFLPAITVAALYAGVWVFLLLAGKGESALATLCLLVVLLVVPVLLARACLRYVSFDLRIDADALRYRRGWFRPHWHKLGLDEVSGARAVLSTAGRMLGGGALVLTREVGPPVRLNDVDSPERAAREINRRVRRIGSAGTVQ